MATRKITKPTTETIIPEKDMTIVFKNANVAKNSKLTFGGKSTYVPSANGKDLCIVTLLGNIENGDNSGVVTTIKNYFKYAATNINLVTVGTSENSSDNVGGDELFEIGLQCKAIGYVLGKKKITGMLVTSLGGKNSTTYNINTMAVDGFLYELGGNDKYTFSKKYENSDDRLDIYDFAGKDTYNLINGSVVKILDQGGNDKYTFTESAGAVKDFLGKDKYTLTSANKMQIDDLDGNDTYKLTNVSNADEYGEQIEGCYINDIKGNDKYTVSGADTNIVLTDNEGKDTYNIKGSYAKKTKIISYVGFTQIDDTGEGKNTFNVTYGGESYLNTDSEENIYNIKNSDFTTINSKTSLKFKEGTGSKDKYTLTSNNYFEIRDFGTSDDIYKFTKSPTGAIQDNGGDDTYTVDKLTFNLYEDIDSEIYGGLLIDDRGGDNDTLILKGSKSTDLVYMSDFHKTGENSYMSYNNSLIIYDKSTQGYVYIEEFFSEKDDDSHDFDGYGEGKIETIRAKVGKKVKEIDITTNSDYYTKLNNVKEDVVNWLNGKSNDMGGNIGNVVFGCVEDVLKYGSDSQKATLVGYFENNAML